MPQAATNQYPMPPMITIARASTCSVATCTPWERW